MEWQKLRKEKRWDGRIKRKESRGWGRMFKKGIEK